MKLIQVFGLTYGGGPLDKIRLAIVGCGGMGNRHFSGLVELARAGLSDFEFVAACDPISESAEKMAQRAEEELGKKAAVAGNLEELESMGVQAIDVAAVPWSHHEVAIEALQRGMHVMIEKPMGVTVRACNVIMEAAKNAKNVLTVAENFHYDPMNRLGKELLQTGAIGDPRSMLEGSIGGGVGIIGTPWRHLKSAGGPLLDVGVHSTYVTEYMMGAVESVYAQTRLYEKVRKNKEVEIEADAEDAAYATFLFHSGAIGQYIEDHAGHGRGVRQRVIYGSKGSLHLPSDRSGNPITLAVDGQDAISDEGILDFVPEFSLNKVTAALFGGERLWRYDLPFQETDRKLLALEYADFAESILKGRPSEVDLERAAGAVGLIYAMLESSKIGRAVTMEEIMKDEVSAYQDDINRMISLAD